MRRNYAILDVFSDVPLSGNALALVLDSAGLDDAAMQAIAREFNLSETGFILKAKNPAHTARLRIFTPTRELPFAGHPTIGCAVLLARQRLGEAEGDDPRDMMLVLEEETGIIRCGATIKGSLGRAVFDLPILPQQIGGTMDLDGLAGALGLSKAEIGFENHHPSVFSAGVPFAFVPVRNLAAIGKARAEPSLFSAAFREVSGVFLYTRETMGIGRQFHARMFAPMLGIVEDPATGAAVAALSGVIHRFDALTSGWHTIVVEQGFEMGRPSLITLEVEIEASRLKQVRIGGDAVILARGSIEID